jgi:hypothetical protein
MQDQIASASVERCCKQQNEDDDRASVGLADRAVTAWHHIHPAVRALPMPMHPDKLFRLTAGRAARHHMWRNL